VKAWISKEEMIEFFEDVKSYSNLIEVGLEEDDDRTLRLWYRGKDGAFLKFADGKNNIYMLKPENIGSFKTWVMVEHAKKPQRSKT